MQLLASTWDSVTARHPLPPGGASPPSPYNEGTDGGPRHITVSQ